MKVNLGCLHCSFSNATWAPKMPEMRVGALFPSQPSWQLNCHLASNENIHIMQIIVWQRLQNWRICSVHFSSLTFKVVVVEIRSVATEKCLNFRITSAWNRLSSFKTLFESREETLTVTSCNSSSAYTSSLSRKVESSTKCHTFQSFSDFFFL